MNEIDEYFETAMKYFEKKDYKISLKYFLKAEKIKEGYSSLNIGYLHEEYALSLGKKARRKALQWYKKAAKTGDCSAMNNIAIMYREEYMFKKAKKWFLKSIQCGENETYYELAKLYLIEGNIKKAIQCLEVFKADRLKLNVSEGTQEDALNLLKKIQKNVL